MYSYKYISIIKSIIIFIATFFDIRFDFILMSVVTIQHVESFVCDVVVFVQIFDFWSVDFIVENELVFDFMG